MSLLVTAALVALFSFGQGVPAAAHTTSTGLALITVVDSTVTYRLTVLLGELPAEAARMLASASDGDETSVEQVARKSDMASTAEPQVGSSAADNRAHATRSVVLHRRSRHTECYPIG